MNSRKLCIPLVVLLVAASLLLAACGGGRTQNGLIRRINPPSAGLDGLAVETAGIRVSVRLQNFSTIPMRYGAVDAVVSIDGREAGNLRFDADIEIPGLNSDVVVATLTLDEPARKRLEAASANARPFAYRLAGSIDVVEPDQRYDFTFESRLNPVPGRAGEFR